MSATTPAEGPSADRSPPPDVAASIDALALPPGPTSYLKGRWLDQLEWFERKAGTNQRTHRNLRIVSLVGGVISPVLINAAVTNDDGWLQLTAVLVSVIVGITVALEGFLRPGDKWLQYRQSAELLRGEWWLYVSLAGEYSAYASVAAAHQHFVERVEKIIGNDIAGYVALVTPSAEPPAGTGGGQPNGSAPTGSPAETMG
jgi:hypothetical protein